MNDLLKNIRQSLPQHKAPEELWDGIASQLDEENSIPFEILPTHTAPNKIFDRIYNELEAKKTGKLRTLNIAYRVSAIAASIAVVLTLSLFYKSGHTSNEPMLASVETVTTETDLNMNAAINKDLQDICAESPEVCSTKEFTSLKSKWLKLTAEIERLQSLGANYNQTDRIAMYIKRVEKDKFEVERQMLVLF